MVKPKLTDCGSDYVDDSKDVNGTLIRIMCILAQVILFIFVLTIDLLPTYSLATIYAHTKT